MLVSVIVLFLITEFPQGVLALVKITTRRPYTGRILPVFSKRPYLPHVFSVLTILIFFGLLSTICTVHFPQGVLALISGLKPVYFSTLYLPLGDVMDIAALVNNAINFVLYCAMSRQFRQTFVELFTRKPTVQSNFTTV